MSLYDVVIVGGGPAGLVAGCYSLHARLHTAIIAPEFRGKVNYSFRLRDLQLTRNVWGSELITQFEQAILESDAIVHIIDQVTKITCTDSGNFTLQLANDSTVEARAVILATGAEPQRLYIEGEKEFWGKGVSFSALSHAPHFKGRDVAVVGSNQRALIAALQLAPIARQIYLITPLPHAMTQLPEAEQILALPNITSFVQWEVQAIVGDDFVTGINLVGINGETRQLTVDGVFIETALIPNNEIIRDLAEMDEEGHVIINQRCETRVPGLFAAGDVTDAHAEQILASMGEGTKAALSAWQYLATHPSERMSGDNSAQQSS
jgi:alkyl hydroperoxide reductase subunit F